MLNSPVNALYARGGGWGWYSSNYFLNWYRLTPSVHSYHTGDDLQLPGNCDINRPVYAQEDGEVIFAGLHTAAGVRTTWGNLVVIDYRIAVARYGHLSEVYVVTGDKVSRNQVIGRIGGTGKTNKYWAEHLHYDLAKSEYGKAKLRKIPGYWPYHDKEELLEVFVDPFKEPYGDFLAFEGTPYRTTSVYVNARERPSSEAKRKTLLYPGEQVTISNVVYTFGQAWGHVAEVGYWASLRFFRRV